jgi:hypothetical protein
MTEERILEMEDKIEKILHAQNHKEKKWNPKITIHKNSGTQLKDKAKDSRVEEGT